MGACGEMDGQKLAFLLLTFAQTALVNSTFAVVARALQCLLACPGLSSAPTGTP